MVKNGSKKVQHVQKMGQTLRTHPGVPHHSGHCYHVPGHIKTRAEAQVSCESMNSTLASIHSDAENAFISSICMESGSLDGDGDMDGLPACYIGLKKTGSGQDDWAWIDGNIGNILMIYR